MRVKPGIYFADDPAFKGVKRELTAYDFVYSMKRMIDPRMRSPNIFLLRGRLVGIDDAIAQAKGPGRLDYDRDTERLRPPARPTRPFKLPPPAFPSLAALPPPPLMWGRYPLRARMNLSHRDGPSRHRRGYESCKWGNRGPAGRRTRRLGATAGSDTRRRTRRP